MVRLMVFCLFTLPTLTWAGDLTPAELEKLRQFTENPLIVKCAVAFEFDAFLDTFGLDMNIEEPQNSTESLPFDHKLEQFRGFLKSHRLTPRPNRPKGFTSKDLARDCQIIAQAAVEAQALRFKSLEEGTPDKKPIQGESL